MKRYILIAFSCLFFILFSCAGENGLFQSVWPENVTRYWIGQDYWSNMLQDWRIHDGRLECIGGEKPLRTVQLLSRFLSDDPGKLAMSVHIGVISASAKLDENAWAGFLIGAGGNEMDYRKRAIIHQATGPGGGLVAAINGVGRLVFFDNENELTEIIPASVRGEAVSLAPPFEGELRLAMKPDGDFYTLRLELYDAHDGVLKSSSTIENVAASRLGGNVALASHYGAAADGKSFWFRNWRVRGDKVVVAEEQRWGPILNAMYTLSRNVLKMTVQLAPIAETDPHAVSLQIKDGSMWKDIAKTSLVVPGWYGNFHVENWDDSKDHQYRIVYAMPNEVGALETYYYNGMIRKDPKDKDEIVVAAFTGNNNTHGSFGKRYEFSNDFIWFPHNDIIRAVKKRNPDVLFYSGDQVYEGRPVHPDFSGTMNSCLDYLYKWYLWCWAHGELAKDRPCIAIPDDHDVYHGNLWGAGGRKAPKRPTNGVYPQYYRGFEGHWQQDQGGYKMPAAFVNMVQGTQTSNLPDPFDPTPVQQGIGVYYTDMNYGGVSFAILEDRKWKSAPSVVIPDGKVINGFLQARGFDVRKTDVPGASLLGERQLKFLEVWAQDWKDAWFKVALSQTIFANVSTYPENFKTDAGTPRLQPEQPGVIPKGYKLAVDMDSNGWPQSARNRALEEMRKGFAFHIAGDQHLGSITHYGVSAFEDAGFAFCVPSIANLWPRRWYPPYPGGAHKPGMPAYTGNYLDGFGNHITVWAVSNPVVSNHKPARLHDRAPGYGIIRLNKKDMTITMECWPRYADPSDSSATQYPGWPMTISLYDNYGRKAQAWLPTLEFKGLDNPVVQVVDEKTGDIVYTVRVRGVSFRPKVFKQGFYTVNVGEPGTDKMKRIRRIASLPPEYKWATVGIAILLAIGTAALKTFKFQELWISYRTIAETLKKEEHFYRARIGDYQDVDDTEALFVERVESLISRENTLWVMTHIQKDEEQKRS